MLILGEDAFPINGFFFKIFDSEKASIHSYFFLESYLSSFKRYMKNI